MLKLIFKYECIMNYFDKKLLQPSYQLGSNINDIPYKSYFYNNNLYIYFFIVGLILFNLQMILFRNKDRFITNITIFNIVMWLWIEYVTFFHATK